jgi:hypothetical protein
MNPQWNDDVREIPSVIRAIYECISGPAGAPRDWERFPLPASARSPEPAHGGAG